MNLSPHSATNWQPWIHLHVSTINLEQLPKSGENRNVAESLALKNMNFGGTFLFFWGWGLSFLWVLGLMGLLCQVSASPKMLKAFCQAPPPQALMAALRETTSGRTVLRTACFQLPSWWLEFYKNQAFESHKLPVEPWSCSFHTVQTKQVFSTSSRPTLTPERAFHTCRTTRNAPERFREGKNRFQAELCPLRTVSNGITPLELNLNVIDCNLNVL